VRQPRGAKQELLGTPLTPRERQIAALIAAAKANKEIAWELRLTEGTIKEYVNRIFHKTGCGNRTALAMWWIQSQPADKAA
jgi:DNA-binding NarL/FixJ family response regulator